VISVCIGSVRDSTLPHAIRAIQNQTVKDWELLVVLQGTAGADEARTLAQTDDRVALIQDDGRGLSRARNLAASRARGDILAFTDDDCEPSPQWLAVIQERFAKDPELGILAGSVEPGPRLRRGFSTCPALLAAETRHDPAVSRVAPSNSGWIGANFALRTSAFRAIGQFDERLGAGAVFRGGEEIDYKLRAEAAGIVVATTPDSVVRHTFGRRYGLTVVWRLLSGYGFSTGAVAAKMAISGDPRGARWAKQVRDEARAAVLQPRLRSPRTLIRGFYFWRGYRAATRALQPPPATANG
jgi:glycosyltransferase involved in cell wall biosynthesis